MKIAYVAPMMDMTFIIDELEAHEQAGWEVLPLSSCRPLLFKNFSEIMVKWGKRTLYRPSIFVQICTVVREMVKYPLRFAKVCCWLMTMAVRSPSEFVKALNELTAACVFAPHCRRFGAEHIHVHFASRSLSLGIMLGMLTDSPISCTVHAFDIFTRSPGSLRPRLAKCKFVSAISKFNIEYLRSTCGEHIADLCHLVHCGIDVNRFQSVSRRPKPGLMVCVARLNPKKGLDIAIKACAKLRRENVKFMFHIIGYGTEQRKLERQIKQLGLEDCVVLLGPRPNDQLMPFLSEASIYLMPCVRTKKGDMDGIPVSMMEALACRVPVVSSNISGIPELVEDGVSGYLVPQGDVDSLADAIKQLLGDNDKIERFGEAGRQRVIKDFCIEENTKKLRHLIEA